MGANVGCSSSAVVFNCITAGEIINELARLCCIREFPKEWIVQSELAEKLLSVAAVILEPRAIGATANDVETM